MESGAMIRPLGKLEMYSTSRHTMGHYQCVGNTCTYTVPKLHLGQSPFQVVEQALAQTILALATLQVGIADEDSPNPYFVQLPAINLATHMDWKKVSLDEAKYTEHLLRAIEKQHEISWPDVHRESPWKLIVFENTLFDDEIVKLDMMFAVHHALSDGKSTSVFHTQLLQALNDTSPKPTVEDHMLHFTSPPVITPPQEDLVNFRVSWRYFLAAIWEEFAPSWLRGQRPRPWTGGTVREDRSVHARLLEVDPRHVEHLRQLCREKGTSLMPLIQALVVLSLSRRLTAAEFSSMTVVSLRPYVQPSKLGPATDLSKSMTDLVSVAPHSFNRNTTSRFRQSPAGTIPGALWGTARTIHTEVQQKARTLPNDDVMGLLEWVDWKQRAQKMMGKHRSETWELSNLGVMAGSVGEGPWEITRSIFTQSAQVIGAGICVNTSSIESGMMTISLTWQDGIMETDLMENLTGDVRAWVAELGTAESSCPAQ